MFCTIVVFRWAKSSPFLLIFISKRKLGILLWEKTTYKLLPTSKMHEYLNIIIAGKMQFGARAVGEEKLKIRNS